MILKQSAPISLIALIISAACLGTGCSTLRFRSEAGIRKEMLDKTPLGSSTHDVISFIENNNHNWANTNTPTIYPKPAYDFVRPRKNPTGVKRIGPKHLGTYYSYFPGLPIYTEVFAAWAFDEDNKLIEIKVGKELFVP